MGSVLGISSNTINTYMQLIAGSEYSFQELLDFDTGALSELFSPKTTLDTARHNELMFYFEESTRPGIIRCNREIFSLEFRTHKFFYCFDYLMLVIILEKQCYTVI